MNTRNLIAVAVIAAALTSCSSAPSTDEPTRSPSSTSLPDADPTTSDTHDHQHEHHDAPVPPVPTWSTSTHQDVLARAEGFVRAWARPDLDATDWFAGLQGFLSPAAAEGFLWTDPSLVPATAVTGPASLVGDGSPTSATVMVPTDAGELHVLLIHTDDQSLWQVASVTPPDEQELP